MIMDLLADVLCRVRNGWDRKLNKISVPNSKFVKANLELLAKQGCIGQITDLGQNKKNGGHSLEVELIYDSEGCAPYRKISKISKCSLRRYSDVKHLDALIKRYPHQLYVVSTSTGVMTVNEAVAKNKGGELLFKVY